MRSRNCWPSWSICARGSLAAANVAVVAHDKEQAKAAEADFPASCGGAGGGADSPRENSRPDSLCHVDAGGFGGLSPGAGRRDQGALAGRGGFGVERCRQGGCPLRRRASVRQNGAGGEDHPGHCAAGWRQGRWEAGIGAGVAGRIRMGLGRRWRRRRSWSRRRGRIAKLSWT